MLEQWRRRRAAQRVRPGDGRALRPFRWWQLPGRALFGLDLATADGRPLAYAVDVRHWGNQSSGRVEAQLYLDGRQAARSRLPAAFPVPGGHIEVAMSGFGLRRCHFVRTDGQERQLIPDPRSAEGRRARLDRTHPTASRWIAVVSVTLLVLGLGLNLVQALGPLSQVPALRDAFGTYTPPVRLPLWLNLTLGLGAVVGSTERALRLRYSRLLDSAGN